MASTAASWGQLCTVGTWGPCPSALSVVLGDAVPCLKPTGVVGVLAAVEVEVIAKIVWLSVQGAHLNDGGKEGSRSNDVSDHNPLQAEHLGDLAHDLVPRQHSHKIGQRLCTVICVTPTSML